MAVVFASSVIKADVDNVWKIIRNFNSLMKWHPSITHSYIENNEPDDKISCIRNFEFKGGGNIREKLLALNDIDYYCSYSILESSMDIENYIATIRLLPITDKSWCYIEWKASFDCNEKDKHKFEEMIKKEVFYQGFDGIRNKLKI